MSDKISTNLTVGNHNLKIVENFNGCFVIIDDKYAASDLALFDFVDYYTQAKFTEKRKLYRAIDQARRPITVLTKISNWFDDLFDFGRMQANEYRGQFFKQIGRLAYDVDNECVVNRSLPKKQKQEALTILVEMFDTNNPQLDQLSKTYHMLGEQAVSEIIEYNDTVLRKRYNVAK